MASDTNGVESVLARCGCMLRLSYGVVGVDMYYVVPQAVGQVCISMVIAHQEKESKEVNN